MELMTTDVIELREFYAKPTGKTVLGLLRRRLSSIFGRAEGEVLVAYGYGTPILKPFAGEGTVIALMPGGQGAIYWPREQANKVCLCDEVNWPLPDESVDRIIFLHAIEAAHDPEGLLREAWRVLKGQGRLFAAVPNRRGRWAHSDKTPFGTGEPYTAGQIRRLITEQGFSVIREEQALFFPPMESPYLLAVAEKIEIFLSGLLRGFGGLLLVEGVKQIYTPVLTKNRVSSGKRFVVSLPFSPSPRRLSRKSW